MGIEKNDTDSFPGAGAWVVAPITAADCCLYPSVPLLEAALVAAGVPVTWRAHVLWVGESLSALQARCWVGQAEISSVVPDGIVPSDAATIAGSRFGEIEGEVWLTDNASWESSVVKVQQSVSSWGATAIGITVSEDGLPVEPAHVYVFVVPVCGTRNPLGFEVQLKIPVVTGTRADPLTEGEGAWVDGAYFGSAWGKVWLTDNASWDASVVKVDQDVGIWGTTMVRIVPSRDGLPAPPAHVYVFVEAAWGGRNLVGFETELQVP